MLLLWIVHNWFLLLMLVQSLRRIVYHTDMQGYITGIKGLSEAQKASLRALGAFEETSVSG